VWVMKINLKNLKKNHTHLVEFEFQTTGREELLASTGGVFAEPINTHLTVENTGELLVGHGTIKTTLQMPCSRCLKEISWPIRAEFDFSIKNPWLNRHLDEDEAIIFCSPDTVDIRSGVEEAIVMAIPLAPVCSSKCQGLCPICGKNRNEAACQCKDQEIDPRWEKLQNFR
jgi:uncharacterized protein